MKKVLLAILLALPLSLVARQSANASSASSTVIQNVNASSTNSNSQVESHTDITVETNGKTTRYTSDEPNKNIQVESVNGTSSIKVDGQEVSGNDDDSEDPKPTISKFPTPDPSDNTTIAAKMNLEIKESLLNKLISLLERVIFFWRD